MTILEDFFLACSNKDLKKVETTYESGQFNIDAKSPEGWTGLIISCFNENIEIARFLINNGANVNATNKKGTSVFMYAKSPVLNKKGSIAILELLLDEGANINHIDCYEKSVLDYVLEKNSIDLAKWLISKGAKTGNTIYKINNTKVI